MRYAARSPKSSGLRPPSRWFWFALGLLFLFSAALRFWGLSRFNTLVFDEVYYAKYGYNYLHHIPFFDVHPPLGKYLIALGIWLSQFHPWGYTVQTQVDDFQLPTAAYRWFNALTGSFIPLVVAGLAYQLSDRRSYALLAGFFVALDGLILVESRYALINIYLVFFGLLGQGLVLRGVRDRGSGIGGQVGSRGAGEQRSRGAGARGSKGVGEQGSGIWGVLRRGLSLNGSLLGAGICFGAAMSVKWNGLFFLTGIYALWGLGWVLRFWQGWRTQPSVHSDSGSGRVSHQRQGRSPSFNWLSFTQIPLLTWIVHLGIVPLLVYCLLWIPHLWLNPDMGFWELHQQILGYHQNLGSGETEHPYCSTWQSWLGMVRPISYYYQSVMPANTDGVISVQQPVVYDVHGMGNPILWWCSTIAIFLLLGLLIGAIARHLIHLRHTPSPILSGDGIAPIPDPQTLTPNTYIWFYLIVNYAANLLPWTWVSRCLFIYHYMGAGIFAIMAIALFVDYSLRTSRLELRPLGIVIILAVVMGFCIWLPLFLGLPLTPEGFQARMWLRSWI